MDREEARLKFGKRIQRSDACFVAFHVKDMWLAQGGAFYCSHCKDDSMFHFDDYSHKFDLSQVPSMRSDDDDPHQ